MKEKVLEIKPVSVVGGRVRPPGSKSYTNRALIAAALAERSSVLRDAAFCEDSIVMMEALRKLGLEVQGDEKKSMIEVRGAGGPAPSAGAKLDVRNAGTAMRFLPAYLALGKGTFVVDGSARMRKRPIKELEDTMRQLGVEIKSRGGFPPVELEAQGLRGGKVEIDASRSSQVLSGLLLAAPYAEGDLEIMVSSEPVSRPYIDMTLDVMAAFGVKVGRQGYALFKVKAGQGYKGRDYEVEADASGASYFLAAAAITGGRILIEGFEKGSLQADARFAEILREMGCRVEWKENGVEVEGRRLRGVEMDLSDAPDLVPTLAATAVFAEGPTRIRNVANLRIKESDRLSALATELGRAGIKVIEQEDGLEVYPGEPRGGVFETYDDHRIAMSMSLLGLRTKGVIIKKPGCVSKTYPHFFEDLERVSVR